MGTGKFSCVVSILISDFLPDTVQVQDARLIMWFFYRPLYLIMQNYQWHSNYPLHFSPCDSLLQLLTLWLFQKEVSLWQRSYLAHKALQ